METEKDSHQLGLEQGINIGRSQMKREFKKIIDDMMVDIELCYTDDPDNCADDDKRWMILKELKQNLKEIER